MKKSKGVSALPMVLLLSSIILQIIVTSLATSQLFGRGLLNEQLSAEALEAAKSGAADGIVKVRDYINCPNATYCPSTSTLAVGRRTACVSISATSGGFVIYSRGKARSIEKTVQVNLDVSTSTGDVQIRLFKEVVTPADIFSTCVQ